MLNETGILKTIQEYHLVSPLCHRLFKSKLFLELVSILLYFCKKPNSSPLLYTYPLEEETATHSSILAWKIPWTEEPGGLQSMGSQRVAHD